MEINEVVLFQAGDRVGCSVDRGSSASTARNDIPLL
jgi:hypothetical protein